MFNPFAIENVALEAVSLVLLVVKGWALIDAALQRKDAFPAADRQTKAFWLIVLGLFMVEQLIFPNPIDILGLIGTIAALVYLLDVRPTVRSLTRR